MADALTAPFQKSLRFVPSCSDGAPWGCFNATSVTTDLQSPHIICCAARSGLLVSESGPPYCHNVDVSSRATTTTARPTEPGLEVVSCKDVTESDTMTALSEHGNKARHGKYLLV